MHRHLKKNAFQTNGTVVLPVLQRDDVFKVDDDETLGEVETDNPKQEELVPSEEQVQELEESIRKTVIAELEEKYAGELNDKLATVKNEASEEAYERGVIDTEKRFEESLPEIEEKLTRLDKLLNKISEFNFYTEDRDNEFLVEVIFESICKIIGEKTITKAQVLNVINYSINQINENLSISLYVSPIDFDLIGGEVKNSERPLQKINILPSENIELGGCLIETDEGVLDARLDTQLHELKQLLISEKTKLFADAN